MHYIFFQFAADTGMSRIAKLTNDLKIPETELLVTEGGSPITRPIVTGEEIKAVLDKYQIAYTQYEYTESTDITPCFNEANSCTGNGLLDVLTQTQEFRKSVSEVVYNNVMGFVKENMRVAKCSQTEEERYFTDNVSDILLVSK